VTQLLPAAVLFDMDGTIVDSEPYWLAEQDILVHSFGGEWTHEDGLSLVGSGLWAAAAVLQGRGVDMEIDDIVQLLTSRVLERIKENLPWRPGAKELLKATKDAGIPTALVTMSVRRMAEHVVSTIPFAGFDVIVAGDDVTHSKPHPEPYLRAAELLGVKPEDCIAIEDSTTGLAAAVASGAHAIGVPLHSPLSETLGYTIWPTLAGKTVADFSALLASSTAPSPKASTTKAGAL
jgi:HAD superfamily hydrolase (TIGR01509 family)